MWETDTYLPFLPIWWAQIQISPEIGVGESDVSLLLFNQTASSSLWQAGKMAVQSREKRKRKAGSLHGLS